MSSTRYFELDSSFRDRRLFKYQGEFQVAINKISAFDALEAKNPVANSYPVTNFNSTLRSIVGSFGHLHGPGTAEIPNLNIRGVPISNHYKGLHMSLLGVLGTPVAYGWTGGAPATRLQVGLRFKNTSALNIDRGVINNVDTFATGSNIRYIRNYPVGGPSLQRKRTIEICVPHTTDTTLELLRGYYAVNTASTIGTTATDRITLDADTPLPTAVATDAVYREPYIVNNIMMCIGNDNKTYGADTGTIAWTNAANTFDETSLSITQDATTTTFTLDSLTFYTAELSTAPDNNDYVMVKVTLNNGNVFGGTYKIDTYTAHTAVKVTGVITTPAGKSLATADTDGDINHISLQYLKDTDVILAGTDAKNILHHKGTNIIRLVNQTYINTLKVDDLVQFLIPGDKHFSGYPLTVYNFGTYADGAKWISFHEDISNVLVSRGAQNFASNIQNTFTANHYNVSLIRIGKYAAGGAPNVNVNETYILSSPINVNMTLSIHPTDHVSMVSVTNENYGINANFQCTFTGGYTALANNDINKTNCTLPSLAPHINNTYYETLKGIVSSITNTLGVAIAIGDATITLTSSTNFPNQGVVKVNDEVIPYNANNTATGVLTLSGVTVFGHLLGDTVSFIYTESIVGPATTPNMALYTRGPPCFNTNTNKPVSQTNLRFNQLTFTRWVDGAVQPLNTSMIASYDATTRSVVLDSSFESGNWNPLETKTLWKIQNDLYVDTKNDANPKMNIQGGSSINNFYTGYYIEPVKSHSSESTKCRKITAYSGSTGVATLEGAFSDYNTNDLYVIRKEKPVIIDHLRGALFFENIPYKFEIVTPGTNFELNTNYTASAPTAAVNHSFTIKTTKLKNEPTVLKGLEAGTIVFSMSLPLGTIVTINNPSGNNATIRITDVRDGISLFGHNQIDANADYKNHFMFLPHGRINNAVVNESAEITASMPHTTSSTSASFSSLILADYKNPSPNKARIFVFQNPIIPNAVYTTALTGATSYFGQFNLLGFSNDSVNNFSYCANNIITSGKRCLAIRLIHLILPNQLLRGFIAGYIRNHPFFYVEVSNKNSGALSNIIHSNNYSARNALFKVAICDTSCCTSSSFIKLNGHNKEQTVKFTINDQLYFRVFYKDGVLFRTVTEDHMFPLAVNELLQVSALFSYRAV